MLRDTSKKELHEIQVRASTELRSHFWSSNDIRARYSPVLEEIRKLPGALRNHFEGDFSSYAAAFPTHEGDVAKIVSSFHAIHAGVTPNLITVAGTPDPALSWECWRFLAGLMNYRHFVRDDDQALELYLMAWRVRDDLGAPGCDDALPAHFVGQLLGSKAWPRPALEAIEKRLTDSEARRVRGEALSRFLALTRQESLAGQSDYASNLYVPLPIEAAPSGLDNLFVREYSLLKYLRLIEEISTRLSLVPAPTMEDERRKWEVEESQWHRGDVRMLWFARVVRERHELEIFIRVQQELLRVALAVGKYQADRGDVPPDLTALVPDYVPAISSLSSGRLPSYRVIDQAAEIGDPELAEPGSLAVPGSPPANVLWVIKRRPASTSGK